MSTITENAILFANPRDFLDILVNHAVHLFSRVIKVSRFYSEHGQCDTSENTNGQLTDGAAQPKVVFTPL